LEARDQKMDSFDISPILPLIPQEIYMRLIYGIIVSRNSIAVVSTCLNLEVLDQTVESFIIPELLPLIPQEISMWLIHEIVVSRNSIAVVSTYPSIDIWWG